VTLEDGADVEHLAQLLLRPLRHVGPVAGPDLDPTSRLERTQGLTHGHGADPVVLGEDLGAQPLTGHERAGDDGLLQEAVDPGREAGPTEPPRQRREERRLGPAVGCGHGSP
jgi:hypothetical protein